MEAAFTHFAKKFVFTIAFFFCYRVNYTKMPRSNFTEAYFFKYSVDNKLTALSEAIRKSSPNAEANAQKFFDAKAHKRDAKPATKKETATKTQPKKVYIPQPGREAPQDHPKICAQCPPCDGAWQAPPSENASEAPRTQKIAKVPPVSEDWALAFAYFVVTCWWSMVVTRFLRYLYPEISRDAAILFMIGLPIINGMILLYENWLA